MTVKSENRDDAITRYLTLGYILWDKNFTYRPIHISYSKEPEQSTSYQSMSPEPFSRLFTKHELETNNAHFQMCAELLQNNWLESHHVHVIRTAPESRLQKTEGLLASNSIKLSLIRVSGTLVKMTGSVVTHPRQFIIVGRLRT